jgi:hypothetical protein
VRALKAFFLGAVATSVLVYTALTTLAVAVHVSGGGLSLTLGGLTFLEARADGGMDVLVIGPGVVLAGLAGGSANALAAAITGRRSR